VRGIARARVSPTCLFRLVQILHDLLAASGATSARAGLSNHFLQTLQLPFAEGINQIVLGNAEAAADELRVALIGGTHGSETTGELALGCRPAAAVILSLNIVLFYQHLPMRQAIFPCPPSRFPFGGVGDAPLATSGPVTHDAKPIRSPVSVDVRTSADRPRLPNTCRYRNV
jgi:hypothetical protein